MKTMVQSWCGISSSNTGWIRLTLETSSLNLELWTEARGLSECLSLKAACPGFCGKFGEVTALPVSRYDPGGAALNCKCSNTALCHLSPWTGSGRKEERREGLLRPKHRLAVLHTQFCWRSQEPCRKEFRRISWLSYLKGYRLKTRNQWAWLWS